MTFNQVIMSGRSPSTLSVAWRMPHQAAEFSRPMLSREPGFFTVDLKRSNEVSLPPKTGGLLAFLHGDETGETVVKILLCDDLADEFLSNHPFSGHSNLVAYRIFPTGDAKDRIEALAERLKLYTKLTEKYRPCRD